MPKHRSILAALIILAASGGAFVGAADEKPWTDLIGTSGLSAWNAKGKWEEVADVTLDPSNDRRLVAKAGHGVIWNNGRSPDLFSKESYGDIELHAEFMIPKKSNSGIKFEGLYEIQILDSFGVEKPKGSDCGGIYPRAEQTPKYHYLDEGKPPRVNAAKPAGEWQTLDVVFRAPRFDGDGKKTADARFVKVLLNGTLIHENVDQATATGHYWHKKEIASGPIMLQGDHGAVAFRNIRVRPLADEKR
jgi:hypothetical protein